MSTGEIKRLMDENVSRLAASHAINAAPGA